ncbi:penicillin-binding protein, partial [Streptomyces broussonetiae]
SGTGTNAQALGRPVAGKTGTTDDYKSAWFIGYTPQLTTAVSMFKEDAKNAGLQSMQGVGGFSKVFGADMPTEVWTGYMSAALQGQPVQQFPPAPQLGHGSNEFGAPSATPSPSPSKPSATPSTSGTPSPTARPCRHHRKGCPSPSPTGSSGTTNGGTNGGWTGGTGGGGLLGGTTGGGNGNGGTTTGGTSSTPTNGPTRPGPGG